MRDWSKAEWVDPKYDWKPLPVPEMPDRLLIDYATRCNLRCHMCPVWGLEDDNAIDNVKGIMNLDAARRMLDEFTNAQPMVAPSIYGEPLLIPNLREVLTDLKRRGIAIAMNTNGLTLTEDIAAFFCDIGVDSVMFSLDSTTPETLMKVRGVDKLAKIEAAVFRCCESEVIANRRAWAFPSPFKIPTGTRLTISSTAGLALSTWYEPASCSRTAPFPTWSSRPSGCPVR
jgi:hypothetical protein